MSKNDCICSKLFPPKKDEIQNLSDFSLEGKMNFTEKNMSVKGKIILDKNDENNLTVTGKEFAFVHKPWGLLNYSVIQKDQGIKLNSILRPFSNFSVYTSISLDNIGNITSSPLSLKGSYKFNNGLTLASSFEDFDLTKKKKVETVNFFLVKNFSFLYDTFFIQELKSGMICKRKALKNVISL